jgi:hypothetical protein
MGIREIRNYALARPFRPFLFQLDDGQTHLITHPEIIIAKTIVVAVDNNGDAVHLAPEAISAITYYKERATTKRTRAKRTRTKKASQQKHEHFCFLIQFCCSRKERFKDEPLSLLETVSAMPSCACRMVGWIRLAEPRPHRQPATKHNTAAPAGFGFFRSSAYRTTFSFAATRSA